MFRYLKCKAATAAVTLAFLYDGVCKAEQFARFIKLDLGIMQLG